MALKHYGVKNQKSLSSKIDHILKTTPKKSKGKKSDSYMKKLALGKNPDAVEEFLKE